MALKLNIVLRCALLIFTLVFGYSNATAQGVSAKTKVQFKTCLKGKKFAAIDSSEQYTRTIEEYVHEVYGKGAKTPDTLFIGKNNEMPVVLHLPSLIDGVTVYLLTSEEGVAKLKYRKSLVYLNVVGWIEKQKSEFIIVTFHEFKPQHNCTIHFKHDPKTGRMIRESLKWEYVYGR